MTRIAVVLPAPLGPSNTVIFAVGTTRSRSRNAGFSPKDRLTRESTTVGPTSCYRRLSEGVDATSAWFGANMVLVVRANTAWMTPNLLLAAVPFVLAVVLFGRHRPRTVGWWVGVA